MPGTRLAQPRGLYLAFHSKPSCLDSKAEVKHLAVAYLQRAMVRAAARLLESVLEPMALRMDLDKSDQLGKRLSPSDKTTLEE